MIHLTTSEEIVPGFRFMSNSKNYTYRITKANKSMCSYIRVSSFYDSEDKKKPKLFKQIKIIDVVNYLNTKKYLRYTKSDNLLPEEAYDINIGDTFINSIGNKTTIKKFRGTSVEAVSEKGTVWTITINDLLGRLNLRVYTNYQSNLKQEVIEQINFKNQEETNEKNRKIRAVQREKRSPQTIESNQTREIANASRLVGNTITAFVKRTRVRRFEICANAISA